LRFFLGTHHPHWLATESELFVSRRRLTNRKRLPVAAGEWALDSGGFTELNLYGEWKTSEKEYIKDVERFQNEIERLAWVAPMDWMCEPAVLDKTGKSVREHQLLTVENFLRLREQLGLLVIPVLQGWQREEYLYCTDLYSRQGVDLSKERLVGVGSVCRRQNTSEAASIFRSLGGLRLHGFGVKVTGLAVYGDVLTSADSLAWSYRARREQPLPGCKHKSCANCLRYAVRWRSSVEDILNQTRLEFA
jgi:hypothetical protein